MSFFLSGTNFRGSNLVWIIYLKTTKGHFLNIAKSDIFRTLNCTYWPKQEKWAQSNVHIL